MYLAHGLCSGRRSVRNAYKGIGPLSADLQAFGTNHYIMASFFFCPILLKTLSFFIRSHVHQQGRGAHPMELDRKTILLSFYFSLIFLVASLDPLLSFARFSIFLILFALFMPIK